MSAREEWGPWIAHNGSGIPGAIIDHLVEVEAMNAHGAKERQIGLMVDMDWEGYRCWFWADFGKVSSAGYLFSAVQRYRIRKPRGLIQLQELIETLPEAVSA